MVFSSTNLATSKFHKRGYFDGNYLFKLVSRAEHVQHHALVSKKVSDIEKKIKVKEK